MKKRVLKFMIGSLLSASSVVLAQPVIAPVPLYTYPTNWYTGNALYVLPNDLGNVSGEPYDVAVTANYHFHSGTTDFPEGTRMVLCKKNASTGAPAGMVKLDLGQFVGLPPNMYQLCKGLLLDETNNRVYIFGKINNRAIIACYNLTTLAIDPTFATTGAQLLSNSSNTSVVMDAVLTSNGNLAVLLNEKDANNKSFMSILGITANGSWTGYNQISNSSYNYFGARFRKYPFAGRPNTYWIAGKAENAAAQQVPMLWEVKETGSAPTIYSVTKSTYLSFTSPVVGYGEYLDCDFLGTQVIAIGNTNGMINYGTQGIYAKYNITASPSLTPVSTYKGEGDVSLPGKGPMDVPFTRCLVGPDGYLILTCFDLHTSMGKGRVAYITSDGLQFEFQYFFMDVHKLKGLMKDNSGNIIVGGCDILNGGISTAKFSCYSGAWPGVVNKMINPFISSVDEATAELTLQAFPIPATDQLTINYTGIAGNASIQIIDISGKKVKEQNEISGLDKTLTIDISDLKTGSYFIRLTTNEKSVMKKIVKQ